MRLYSVRTFSDLQTCHRLWDAFSPQKTLYDCWEYRLPFYEAFQFKLHFVVLMDGNAEVGLLPLWQDPASGAYLWYGDCNDGINWQEDNLFWVKDPAHLEPLLKSCPAPAILNSISADQSLSGLEDFPFQKGDPKHILDLKGMRTYEDFLGRQDKKLRQNLRRDYRKIEEMGPSVQVDAFDDFDELIENNIARAENSYLRNPKLVESFRGVIKNGQKEGLFKSRMLSVRIDGQVAGADLIFIHKGVYYPMLCGNRVGDFSGIGNYMNLLDIKDALELNMKIIDFTESEENSYKDKWFTRLETWRLRLS